jgi:DNA repair exonuclease SbcCD ATPase subunit
MDEEDYNSEQVEREDRAKGSVNQKLADLEKSNEALANKLTQANAKLEGMAEAFRKLEQLEKNQTKMLSLLEKLNAAQDENSMVGMIKNAVGASPR